MPPVYIGERAIDVAVLIGYINYSCLHRFFRLHLLSSSMNFQAICLPHLATPVCSLYIAQPAVLPQISCHSDGGDLDDMPPLSVMTIASMVVRCRGIGAPGLSSSAKQSRYCYPRFCSSNLQLFVLPAEYQGCRMSSRRAFLMASTTCLNWTPLI